MDQPSVWGLVVAGLILVNLIALAAFGFDKHFAQRKKRRISETKLLLLVALGGGIGAIAGQKLFRHKTQKQPFKSQIWAIIIVQIGMLLIVYWA